MQLREILDLDAMLSKDPAPESLEEGAADDDEISEKTAGPTYKEEEDIVEEAEEDEEDSMTERRTQRANEDDDDEDNTLSLAAMEELLKPGALEKFATITSLFKEFSKVQEARLAGLGSGDDFPKDRKSTRLNSSH